MFAVLTFFKCFLIHKWRGDFQTLQFSWCSASLHKVEWLHFEHLAILYGNGSKPSLFSVSNASQSPWGGEREQALGFSWVRELAQHSQPIILRLWKQAARMDSLIQAASQCTKCRGSQKQAGNSWTVSCSVASSCSTDWAKFDPFGERVGQLHCAEIGNRIYMIFPTNYLYLSPILHPFILRTNPALVLLNIHAWKCLNLQKITICYILNLHRNRYRSCWFVRNQQFFDIKRKIIGSEELII